MDKRVIVVSITIIILIIIASSFTYFERISQISTSLPQSVTSSTSYSSSSYTSQTSSLTSTSPQTSVLSTSTYTQSPSIILFPTSASGFSLVGSYLSQSRYGMALLYNSVTTLYASPFLWNIEAAQGQAIMNFNPYLNVHVDMSNIKKITPSISVNGYPGLMYGQELWFPFAGKTEVSPYLPLPMIVSNLPNFWSILNFTVYENVGVIDDFSYDIWLSQNPNITYLQYGDFEVMIWMNWQENITKGDPYMLSVGSIQIPTLINGTVENLTWSVYVLPRTGSANGWTSIYFLSPKQLEGQIGIPIAYVLKNMGSYLEKARVSIYNLNTYYLDAIQVGMEFNDTNGIANLGYNLYSWYIENA
ncbi:Extracellular endo-1,4-beta-glucanase [Saccharolobus shibatae B12]|uniref:Extracellular endo-1,4-beta-glucanase n=1 Tax=Saccharolobus shibatae (strain ATCC 51178 / DSM 5389 / JCM 8931 / NBRC 15437 / B12) TaxID=523848 RepID=A0A8F5BPU9_SACSH|nr:cellulase [Saccharolobus shibatae]QXJ29154.1 Extracellular endo-1,4-beta-glucanase [Saccharolobus shibatae B12]